MGRTRRRGSPASPSPRPPEVLADLIDREIAAGRAQEDKDHERWIRNSIIDDLVAHGQIQISKDGLRYVYHTCCASLCFERHEEEELWRFAGEGEDCDVFLSGLG